MRTAGGGMMTQRDDGRLVAEVETFLRQLMVVASAAGRSSEPMSLAAAFAEAQRVTGRGLRAAVELGRARGLSWRELADVLDIPASTLHRQYHKGAAIAAPHDGAATVSAELTPAADGDTPQTGTVPPALDLFVGRGPEITELPELLWRRRLVSLVGPAGVGKTRLASEVAHRVRADYPKGVWWVRLSAVTQEWLIGRAVGTVLAGAGQDLRQVVAQAAEGGAALLILDNCEHLLAGTAQLTLELRDAAPGLRILTTSREALRVRGEAVLPLAPFPPARPAGKGARIADAVRLFAQRARDVRPDFDVDAWVEVVAEICDRLDGLPLAIELAAHQSDLLTPDRLLRRLTERLDVLVDARRGNLDRHHSLRRAIAWSHDLLDATTKAVFARLCVLPDGFDEHTAAAVTGGMRLDRSQLWAVLADLARKSMIVTDAHAPGRFRILESLRAFGLAALTDAGDLAPTQRRLIGWLAGFERQLATNPWGDTLTVLMARITAERENIRGAMDAAAALGHPSHPKLVLLLAGLLAHEQDVAQTERILHDLIAGPAASTTDRAIAHWMLSVNAGRRGDHASATRHADTSVRLARPLGNLDVLTGAVNSLMITRGLTNRPAAGVEAGAELIEVLRAEGRDGSLGQTLGIQAWLLAADGDIEGAHRVSTEAITLYEKQADQKLPMAARFANQWGTTLLHSAAIIAIARGDDATAAEYVNAILTSDFEHHNAVGGALFCAAILAAHTGENIRAVRLHAGATAVAYAHDAFWDDQLAVTIGAARKKSGTAATNAAVATAQAMTVAQLKKYAVSGTLPTDEKPADVLTPSQLRVARRAARGLTNAQIAAELNTSERTVVSHLTSIRTKLDLKNRVEIAMWVAQAQIPPAHE
ncbi:LuxR C-terminal-related transcriptional regulator [Actinoplanes sp. NPDC049265]|uniref:helix-turn-helix transcriptional regulator n=1 Tax=Actinoplanes sp. NPDC049265 TaxID=3363902 RepID=UPI003720EFCF